MHGWCALVVHWETVGSGCAARSMCMSMSMHACMYVSILILLAVPKRKMGRHTGQGHMCAKDGHKGVRMG